MNSINKEIKEIRRNAKFLALDLIVKIWLPFALMNSS